DRDPSTNHRFHLLLAREIFGESEIVSSALLKNSQRKAASHLTGAQLVEKIISDPKMTVERWMAMGWREKPKFRVPDTDIGLRVLAAKLKVEGDPVCTRKSHLLLAQKIFGESETLSSALLEISKHEASTLLTSAELIDRIVSDPKMRVATWIGMTQRERRRYHVPGTEMGLEALATQLEVSGNPIASHKFHLQLAQKIFGESEVLSSALLKNSRQEASLALSPADLINKVKSDPQMTLQRWIAMTQRERVGYRVPGTTMGLRALAGQLDIKGNPTNNHKFHLQLAQKIFGESEVLSSALLRNSRQEASLALSPADLINKVKSDPQMTLQRWIAMTQRERVEYRVPGTTMGLRVLATRLDVDGDPTCNRKSHLMLAQKIFDAAEWGVFPQRPN
ncbi:MAG: hypothetical protein J0M12_14565, partial [Deltaproteobacteria bacterium]|nr:hypothetical protein [Deltaproteobacteria bacterium]